MACHVMKGGPAEARRGLHYPGSESRSTSDYHMWEKVSDLGSTVPSNTMTGRKKGRAIYQAQLEDMGGAKPQPPLPTYPPRATLKRRNPSHVKVAKAG